MRTTGLVEAARQPSQGFRVSLFVQAQTYRGFILRDGFRFATVVVVKDRQLEVRQRAAVVGASLFNRSEKGGKTSSLLHAHHTPGDRMETRENNGSDCPEPTIYFMARFMV